MIDPKLENKIAIITGTNNPYGIGAHVAKALVTQKVKVFLHYYRSSVNKPAPVSDDELRGESFYLSQQAKSPDETLETIQQMGGQVEVWEADLSLPGNIPQLFEKAEAAFGHANILVNNAAYWEADTFLPSSKDVVNKFVEAWTSAPGQINASGFDRIFAVNTRAVAFMMAEFGKRHIKRGASWGRIINISTDGAYSFPSEVS